jgi:glycosyltransferase involved in cell wall biosynthesis
MRIAFVSLVPFEFNHHTPYQEPLGGSESALCYLTGELAKKDHDVFVFNGTRTSKFYVNRIAYIPIGMKMEGGEPLVTNHKCDVTIVQSTAKCFEAGKVFPDCLPRPRILWTGFNYDQPAVAPLIHKEVADQYDKIVAVSHWHREQLIYRFKLPESKVVVIKNGVAPEFINLYPPSTEPRPPTLAYTSTPFRGLELLAKVFPKIRAEVPDAKLEVYSSMKPYHLPTNEDKWSPLYDQLRKMEGVSYFGSIPQPLLARRLKNVRVFSYPCTFQETSCISLLEAMISGCLCVTSDLGALPETASGFAYLAPTRITNFEEAFIRYAVDALKVDQDWAKDRILDQAYHVYENHNWDRLSRQWLTLINEVVNGK